MAVRRLFLQMIGICIFFSWSVHAEGLYNNQTDSIITISGFTYDSVGDTALEGAGVFFHRLRGVNEEIQDAVIAHSDNQGRFSLSISSGTYVVRALKFGYLAPSRKTCEFTEDMYNLDFGFTSPVFSINKDSIIIDAPVGETFSDTLVIENTGSGELFFSTALAATENDLLILSKTWAPVWPVSQVPALYISDTQYTDGTAEVNAPADSLWKLVYRDPEDNKDGTVDIHETWMQIRDNQFYLKVTFHHPIKTAFHNFEYTIQMDTDGDRNTGENAGWDWIGPDHAIAISDYGQGPMAIVARWEDEWRYVRSASYSSLGSSVFICGFPLNVFGNIKMLSFLCFARNRSNPESDIDFVPEYNTGFLVFPNKEIPGLDMQPCFGRLQPNEKDTLIVTIRPDYYIKENQRSYILFSCSQPMKPFRLIPIVMKTQSGIKTSRNRPQKCLLHNYPNPFNPCTTISFTVPKTCFVTLKIYNLLGHEIAPLVHEARAAGEYSVQWEAQNHPAGIYLLSMRAGEFRETRKLILQK